MAHKSSFVTGAGCGIVLDGGDLPAASVRPLAERIARRARKASVFVSGSDGLECVYRRGRGEPDRLVILLLAADGISIAPGAAVCGATEIVLGFPAGGEQAIAAARSELSGTGARLTASVGSLTVRYLYFDPDRAERLTMAAARVAAKYDCRVSVPLAYPPIEQDEEMFLFAVRGIKGLAAAEPLSAVRPYGELAEGKRCLVLGADEAGIERLFGMQTEG